MRSNIQTWHYGIVAKWWAEFNSGGPEISYFRKIIQKSGEPVLDVGCGTGRLLLEFLAEGIDIDGVDVSPDMLAYCRELGKKRGLAPNLYAMPMHALDLPSRYQTIYCCGSFGIGGGRDEDRASLEGFYDLLEPGGVLAVDHYLPYREGDGWQYWTRKARATLPQPWPEPTAPRAASDGSAIRLRSRIMALDPLEQRLTLEMWAEEFRDGVSILEEKSVLTSGLYLRNEFVMMLERAGFHSIEVQAGYEDRAATPDDEILVFIARK